MKKITVITVCYNAEDTIRDTIVSVLSQTYENIEYWIVDGGSKDNTVKIIEEYYSDKRVNYISESDNGLYDAMNKGTDRASGDYVIFMNSGDIFYGASVLTEIEPYLEQDLVYGNVLRIKEQGEMLEKYPQKHQFFSLLLQGRMVCHQSIFIRTEIMKEYRYREKYKITADYDFLVRASKNHLSRKYVDITISRVENREGISSQVGNLMQMRQEDDASLKENYPMWYWMLVPIKTIVRICKRPFER